MAAHPRTGYEYNPGSSMAAIFFNDEEEGTPYSLLIDSHARLSFPQGIDHLITICSSSNGLVAFHNPNSNIYYIGNPSIRASYTTPLRETPREHLRCSTHVVLVTDVSNLLRPVYHLICAILEDPFTAIYTFDTYSSLNGYWLPSLGVDLHGRRIMPNTGVSCGSFAYWLTEMPRSVIRFDVNNPHNMQRPGFMSILILPIDNGVLGCLETRLQLGRVGNQLGLVAVDISNNNPMVILYILGESNNELSPCASLNLAFINRPIRRGQPDGQVLVCSEIPDLLRFQSFKMEVLLWVDKHVVVWENNTVDPQRTRLVRSEIEGHDIANGFAHVCTSFLPGTIPARNQESTH